MKKFLEISGDFLLAFLLLGIILISAFSVISMSPLSAEDFGYENSDSVLGVQSNTNDIIISENVQKDAFKSVITKTEPNFSQDITLKAINTDKFSAKIFNIKNTGDNEGSFRISIYIPDEYKKLANFGIKIDNQEYFLVYGLTGQVDVLNGTIKVDSNTDFDLVIDPLESINYSIPVKVFVEKGN